MCTPTIYTSISSSDAEIRLATLEPGCYEDTLVVNLYVSRLLHEPPEYEALSYVWGTARSPNEALVNGTAMTICANLDCALRHIRYEDRHCTVWIDALCIDQANLNERSSQVQMMNRVYSEAHTVVIWLGPAEDGDAEAMPITSQRLAERRRN